MHSYINSKSNAYAPSSQKLFVDIKDMIEQQFPTLNQDIINDALTYGRNEYTAYLITESSEVASDLEAKEFFFRKVMERILEHNRRQHDTLIAFMLAHQRHNTQNHLTVNQALNPSFSSDLLTLPLLEQQKMFEPILEENHNKFTPQRLKFPPKGFYEQIIIPKVLIDTTRMGKFWSLSDKLQKQLIRIEAILRLNVQYSTKYVRDNVFFQIFDEMYNLSISIYNSNELERSLIDSVSHIITNSNLPRKEKRDFMFLFSRTINNQDNYNKFVELLNKNL